MMRRYKSTILILLLCYFPKILYCQNTVETIMGFKLGQYEDCIKNSLNEPSQERDINGIKYLIYSLTKDNSNYIIFGVNNEIITSIQLFSPSLPVNLNLKNLKMGASGKEVISKLGYPDRVTKNEIGGELFEYKNFNFSLEVNNGILSSIKIIYNQDFYDTPKVEELPTIKKLINLSKTSNKEISKIISPSIEAWIDNNKVLYLSKSWEREIFADDSQIFRVIKNFFNEVKNLNYKKDI